MKKKNLFISFSALLKSFFRKKPMVKVTCGNHHYQIPIRKIYKPDPEEIDALLDKISEKGYNRLTKAEKQKLLNASHSI